MLENYSVQDLISIWNAYCVQENADGYIYDYEMLSSIRGISYGPVVIIARVVGCYFLGYVIPVLVVINLTLLLIAIIPMLIYYIIHYLGIVVNIFMVA